MATGKVSIKLSDIYIGDYITISCPASSTGTKNIDDSRLSNPTAVAGYTFVGWLFKAGSYKISPMGCGSDRLYYYVGTTNTTNLGINAYPVYKRS